MTSGNFDFFDIKDVKDLVVLRNINNLMNKTIKKINLDLSNLTIITEAASNYWAFTPFLAAKANAKKVICFTKDSQYANKEQIRKNFQNLSQFFGIENIKVFYKKNLKLINEADVI